MSSKFLDKTGLDTLWAKIKSTFQTLGNLVTAWGSTPSDTKYPSEKLVKAALDGKMAIYTSGSAVPSSQNFVCLRVSGPYVSGSNKTQLLLFDITSFADGTIVNNDLAYVGFSGFLIGGKPQGSGEKICVKLSAKVAYSQITTSSSYRTLKSDSATCGPEIVKRTEDGVDKYYLSIFYDATLYSGNNVLVGQFLWTKPSGIDSYSYSNGVIGIYYPNETYPAGEPLWERLYSWTSSVAAQKLFTARKLKTNLARTTDSTFDGSADQTNIPVTGTLPIANGGTGATTARGAMYNTLGQEPTLDSTLDGNRLVPIRNNEVSAANGVFRWFKLSNVWEYIKSQISSILGLTETSYGGNAATATTAAGYTSGGAIDTALQGKQGDLGISSSGDASKFLNEKGAWVVPSGVDSAVFTVSGTSITNEMYADIIQAVSEDKIVTLLRGASGNTLMYRLTGVDSAGGIFASRSSGNSIYTISISPIADAHAVTATSDALSLSSHTHGDMANDGTDGQETHDITKFLRADGAWGVPPASYPPTGASGEPVYFDTTGHPKECTMVGSRSDSILGQLHSSNLNSESTALYFCMLSQSWLKGGYLSVGDARTKLTGLTSSAKGDSLSPIFWDGTGFDTGCTFQSASIADVGTSGNTDSKTSTIYADTILNVSTSSYTYSINADRFIINKPYKLCFLKGTSSAQVKLYRPSTGSNINLYSGSTSVASGKSMPLLGGTHGGSFTSTLIRTATNTFYLIWGY